MAESDQPQCEIARWKKLSDQCSFPVKRLEPILEYQKCKLTSTSTSARTRESQPSSGRCGPCWRWQRRSCKRMVDARMFPWGFATNLPLISNRKFLASLNSWLFFKGGASKPFDVWIVIWRGQVVAGGSRPSWGWDTLDSTTPCAQRSH